MDAHQGLAALMTRHIEQGGAVGFHAEHWLEICRGPKAQRPFFGPEGEVYVRLEGHLYQFAGADCVPPDGDDPDPTFDLYVKLDAVAGPNAEARMIETATGRELS